MSATSEKAAVVVILMLVAAVIYLSVAPLAEPPPPEPPPCPPRAPCPPTEVLLYKPFRDVTFTTDLYGVTYHGHTGNLIDRQILLTGAYEKHVLAFLRDTLGAIRPDGGVFLDVGANTGQHAMFMARHAAVVHAVEPFPPVLRRLRAMIEENGIENIVVHPVGLGAEKASVPFQEPEDKNLGTGSFVAGLTESNKAGGELRIEPGDDLLAAAGVSRVDLVKMDIEGYEKPALQGLRRTMESSRPVLVVEISIDPEREVLFEGEAELRQALPDRYGLLQFRDELSDDAALRGRYRLSEPELRFDIKGRANLVFFPEELRGKLPDPAASPPLE